MTTKQQSASLKTLIPDMPREVPLVKDNGSMSDAWKFFFDQLVLALQTNLKAEGFVIPKQTAANIANLTKSTANHNIVYDSTNNAFDGNITTPSGQQWIPFAMITTYAGNPNTNVAGVLNWFCYDTTNVKLYICTTAEMQQGLFGH